MASQTVELRRACGALALVYLGWASGGCSAVLGLDDFEDQPGAGASGGAGNAGGAGGTGAGETGGGGGGGGESSCQPNLTQACYSGPADTEGVGTCAGGTETCAADGSGFGACEGEVTPVTESCAAPADENCDTFDCVTWATVFETTGALEPFAITADSQGNVVTAGFFSQSVTIGAQTYPAVQSTDIYVAKLSPTGAIIWAKTFGDAFEDFFGAVVVTEGDGLVFAGRTNSPVDFGGGPTAAGLVVVKLDANGDQVWTRSCGGDGALIGVALDQAGNVFAAGFHDEPIDCGTGAQVNTGSDIVIVKLDGSTGSAAGPVGWVRTFGSAAGDEAWDIATDSAGAAYVTGNYRGNLDFGGFGGAVTHNGGADAFVVKLSSSGSTVWTRTWSAPVDQEGIAVDVLSDGRAVVAGRFNGTVTLGGTPHTASSSDELLLVAYEAGGTVSMSESFPNAYVFDMKIDQADRIALAGAHFAPVDFGGGPLPSVGAASAFVAKLDAQGAHQWSKTFDAGPGEEVYASALGTGPSNETLVSGQVSAPTIDFGTGPLTTADGGGFVLGLGE